MFGTMSRGTIIIGMTLDSHVEVTFTLLNNTLYILLFILLARHQNGFETLPTHMFWIDHR